MQPPIYPPEAVQPMRDELSAVGFRHLNTPEEVDQVVKNTKGTVLCVINSVCGCAAGGARPGVGGPAPREPPGQPDDRLPRGDALTTATTGRGGGIRTRG